MPAAQPPRYCPERELPPYSYVTGLFPHPTSDARGHSFGRKEPPPQPLDETNYRANATYLYAIDLFNHGFYWEAHEEWESLWHVAGRHGTTADFLKGLIKLAAAGVKAREGRAEGVIRHAKRAAELLRDVQEREIGRSRVVFGLAVRALIVEADRMADRSGELAAEAKLDPNRRLPVTMLLEKY